MFNQPVSIKQGRNSEASYWLSSVAEETSGWLLPSRQLLTSLRVLDPISMWRVGVGSSHQQGIRLHQLGVLQFNLILALSTWRQYWIPQGLQDSVLEDTHTHPSIPASSTSEASGKLRSLPALLTYQLQIGGSSDTPVLGSINLLEWLIEIFYLLDHCIIIKTYHSGISRWKIYIEQGMGKGQKFPCPLQAHHSPQIYSFHQPGISSNPSLLAFLMEVSLHRYD